MKFDYSKFQQMYEAGEQASTEQPDEFRAFRTYSHVRRGVGFGRIEQTHEVAVSEVRKYHENVKF